MVTWRMVVTGTAQPFPGGAPFRLRRIFCLPVRAVAGRGGARVTVPESLEGRRRATHGRGLSEPPGIACRSHCTTAKVFQIPRVVAHSVPHPQVRRPRADLRAPLHLLHGDDRSEQRLRRGVLPPLGAPPRRKSPPAPHRRRRALHPPSLPPPACRGDPCHVRAGRGASRVPSKRETPGASELCLTRVACQTIQMLTS